MALEEQRYLLEVMMLISGRNELERKRSFPTPNLGLLLLFHAGAASAK